MLEIHRLLQDSEARESAQSIGLVLEIPSMIQDPGAKGNANDVGDRFWIFTTLLPDPGAIEAAYALETLCWKYHLCCTTQVLEKCTLGAWC